MWEEGWRLILDTLSTLKADYLSQTITIRTESLTVVDAINRQLAHYSYPIGQIVFLGKWLVNGNWELFQSLKADQKNLIIKWVKNKF